MNRVTGIEGQYTMARFIVKCTLRRKNFGRVDKMASSD